MLACPITVTVEKHPVPVLWLDTSVFSGIGKLRANRPMPQHVRDRFERIRITVAKKLRQRRICSVYSDQVSEIVLDSRFYEPIRDAITQLTWEAQVRHHWDVFFRESHRMAEAYLHGQDCVSFSWNDAFSHDLTHAVPMGPFIIRVDRPYSSENIAEIRNNKTVIHHEWECIRQRNVRSQVTFEVQHEREQCGFLDVVMQRMEHWKEQARRGQSPSLNDPRDYQWSTLFTYWGLLTGKECDLAGLMQFLGSDHFRAAPRNAVSSILVADLLTGPAEIGRGDSMDVQQLSTVLPYCHYVLADGAMVARIRRHGLDRQWNTKVFSIRETDKLVSELNLL